MADLMIRNRTGLRSVAVLIGLGLSLTVRWLRMSVRSPKRLQREHIRLSRTLHRSQVILSFNWTLDPDAVYKSNEIPMTESSSDLYTDSQAIRLNLELWLD